ncbi:MAG: LysR family transcriptional regulator [Burkholderiales bacterium]|jgi:DNA-binding transcriptional LysR family regulator|nr:LysR family transcriptional regulator [Burkholderiales bacterium]
MQRIESIPIMNVSQIDLNLLRAFDAILRDRSVTAAGQRVGLTQPAMSNALARLRAAFGDALFVRGPEGMQPTPFARSIADPVRQALGLIDAALASRAGFDPSTSERMFRFNMSDIGEMVFLPPLLERLHRAAPGVRVEAVSLAQGDLEESLATGAIDLALGALPGVGPPVRSRRLFRDPYLSLVRADHPSIGSRLARRQFLEASHVVVSSVGTGHQAVEAALLAAGLHRRIALRVPHFVVVPMILARTDLIATLPGRIAASFAQTGDFKTLAPPLRIPAADVQVHWHERFTEDAGNRWMRELLFELYEERIAPRRS